MSTSPKRRESDKENRQAVMMYKAKSSSYAVVIFGEYGSSYRFELFVTVKGKPRGEYRQS
jgi:hypothetical protein